MSNLWAKKRLNQPMNEQKLINEFDLLENILDKLKKTIKLHKKQLGGKNNPTPRKRARVIKPKKPKNNEYAFTTKTQINEYESLFNELKTKGSDVGKMFNNFMRDKNRILVTLDETIEMFQYLVFVCDFSTDAIEDLKKQWSEKVQEWVKENGHSEKIENTLPVSEAYTFLSKFTIAMPRREIDYGLSMEHLQ